ncbi:MAG TPA: D-alanyl-D-alanine carboxypeptidase family protein [Steroidobacteraceae bacterium]|jgi:D-alanyl-D-alanine carboxypeptidase (penicillin-binding protein 5/6)|nr:D-alanyl-D-alanine carboxypeptidase family protein [Steroidobacteraceae bacterium]
MFRSFLVTLSFAAVCAADCWAAAPPAAPAAAAAPAAISIPGPPQVDARAYILADYRTGKILAASEATKREEPASLTKLMTAYIVFHELSIGKLKLNDMVTVSEHAWRSEGSRSFVELGKPVSVDDLILGMIVQSGNDATIALAERVAGTEETFAQLMNSTAKSLDMVGSHFENSTGLPAPQHYTTARDMSLLAIAMIRDFPQYYKYYSVREFEHNGIRQQNRNGLLEKDPSVDGLKTGHTDSAGFCLVTSAHREGMRLVSVVLGSSSMKGRENASAALLSYGFTFYDTKLIVKGGTSLTSTHVWKAAQPSADLGIKDDLYLTLARGQADPKTALDVQPRLIAPLGPDARAGTLRVFNGGQILATLPLHPLKAVAAGGWWRRLIDTIRLWFV